jgi:hypothetical protein
VVFVETAEEVVEAFLEELREEFEGFLGFEFSSAVAVGVEVFLFVSEVVGVKIFCSVVAISFWLFFYFSNWFAGNL